MKSRLWIRIVAVALLVLVVGCRPTAPPDATSVAGPGEDGLSANEVATLDSLERVDDYPLYTMHYQGAYAQRASSMGTRSLPAWNCSLFAALADAEGMFYGRNFDWEFSPALLLFTDPPDGFASVSMVDIAYLGFRGDGARSLTALSLAERRALLGAPLIPFDGMNERGLAIGMAAVPPGDARPDPSRETIGSLAVIREILDHASDVYEAVAIFQRYNIDMEGGPPIHYLIADAAGQAVLVEFYEGEMVVISNENPWHLATNFLRASVESPEGQCWRYDTIARRLTESGGRLSAQDAVSLLADVSQDGTQWSIAYGISTGEVSVVMGRQYESVHTFRLDMVGD